MKRISNFVSICLFQMSSRTHISPICRMCCVCFQIHTDRGARSTMVTIIQQDSRLHVLPVFGECMSQWLSVAHASCFFGSGDGCDFLLEQLLTQRRRQQSECWTPRKDKFEDIESHSSCDADHLKEGGPDPFCFLTLHMYSLFSASRCSNSLFRNAWRRPQGLEEA